MNNSLNYIREFILGIIAIIYLERQLNYDIYYSVSAGILKGRYPEWLESFYLNHGTFLHLIFLLSLLLGIFLKSRLSIILAFVLNIVFLTYQQGFTFGLDAFIHRLLLVMCFIQSLTLKKKDWFHRFGINLLFIILWSIYFYSSAHKLTFEEWRAGTWLITLIQDYWKVELEQHIVIKALFLLISWIVMLGQLIFPFSYFKRMRKYILGNLLLMHIGTIFILKLYYFGFVASVSIILMWVLLNSRDMSESKIFG